MSTRTVAKKDLMGARRSLPLWLAALVLGLIAVLLIYVSNFSVENNLVVIQRLFVILTQFLAVLLPIVALAASYVALAGERQGGGIKFLLSMPNTRWDVYAGKLVSRLVVIAVGVGIVYVAATGMSLIKYGVFAGGVIVGTFILTVMYGSVFVSIAIAMSGAAASRSRAIAGALVSYFVLVIAYLLPLVSVGSVARWVHHSMLGFEANTDLYNFVRYMSPYLAYQKAVNLAVLEGLERRFFMDSAANVEGAASGRGGGRVADPDLPVYLADEFSLLILAVWLVVPVLLGFWAFNRAELE